jgi:hypothetical protein
MKPDDYVTELQTGEREIPEIEECPILDDSGLVIGYMPIKDKDDMAYDEMRDNE